MKIIIEVLPKDARIFAKYLNDDDGIRDAVVQQLIMQNKQAGIEQMTSVTATFGAISRGFVLALAAQSAQG